MTPYCKRCGREYAVCWHLGPTAYDLTPERAARINVRYELGKRFDPENHDTNDYYTEDNDQK